MKKFLISLFTSATLTLSSLNGESVKDVKAIYWEIKRGNSRAILFGTIHSKDIRTERLFLKIKPLVEKSGGLYGELAVDGDISQEIIRRGLFKGGLKLSRVLPKESYSKLKTYLQKIAPEVNILTLDKFKVWFVMLYLESLRDGVEKRPSLDVQLYNYAKNLGKEVGGVEDITEQIDIFDKLTLDEQIEILDINLDNYLKYPDIDREIKSYYFLGEYKKLLNIFNRFNQNQDNKLMDRLLYQRNIKMADRIDK